MDDIKKGRVFVYHQRIILKQEPVDDLDIVQDL
jgi:hypothetical protein